MLKSSNGWNNSGNGTDAYFFSALPAGIRLPGGNFDEEGDGALFWSSAVFDRDNAYVIGMFCDYDFAHLLNYNKDFGFSVRCVKD